MAGLSAGDSQVSFEMAHKSLMYHALSKPAGTDSQTMLIESPRLCMTSSTTR
jgi:hypothetical protein